METFELAPLVALGTHSVGPAQALSKDLGAGFDYEAIESSGALGLGELFGRTPGVHVDLNTRSGSVGSLYLRGGDPNFTVVTLNGVKLNDPTNTRGGSFDLSAIDPLLLRQAAIVNGAQSAIHGSEAISGTVQLASYAPGIPEGGSAFWETGTEGLLRGGVYLNARQDFAETYASANYVDGGNAIEGGSFEGRRAGLGTHLDLAKAGRLHVFAIGFESEQSGFPDDSGGPRYAVIRDTDFRESEAVVLGANYRSQAGESVRFAVDASIYDRSESLNSPGVAPGARDPFGIPSSASTDDLKRYQFSAYSEFSFDKGSSLVLGWSGEDEQSEGVSEIEFFGMALPGSYALDRSTSSVFGEGVMAIGERLALQLGARRDDVSGLDAETTLLGGARLEFPELNSALNLRFGQGFKKPSVYALRNPIVGNPDLRPETSDSIDLAWTTKLLDGRGELDVSVFQYEFEDLVDFDPGPPPRLINRSQVKTEGGELAFRYAVGESASFSSYLAYADTRDRSTGARLLSRPAFRGGAFVVGSLGSGVTAMVDVFYVGDRQASSVATGEMTLGGYARLDLRIRWAYSENGEVVLSLDNVLDREYEESVGFLAPGAGVRLGLRQRF